MAPIPEDPGRTLLQLNARELITQFELRLLCTIVALYHPPNHPYGPQACTETSKELARLTACSSSFLDIKLRGLRERGLVMSQQITLPRGDKRARLLTINWDKVEEVLNG